MCIILAMTHVPRTFVQLRFDEDVAEMCDLRQIMREDEGFEPSIACPIHAS